MKKIGYVIFAFWFHFFRLLPVKDRLVFMVATHDDSEEGNIGIVSDALREKRPDTKIIMLTRKDGIRRPVSFFIIKAYYMARSHYIFMDNVFLPMAYLHFSKKAKVIQLWHGTGTIKKFGQDANGGELKRLEYAANQRITHLIVNSEYTKKQYAGAFGISQERIFILGLPRGDLFFNKERMERKRSEFFRRHSELAGKRLILYAPTFRDDQVKNPELGFSMQNIYENLPEDTVLLLRLHPHVAAAFDDADLSEYQGCIVNMSEEETVSTLLYVADVLVTDYSSIIFEYCLLERPMVFYAYDLERFETEGRSFYESYSDYVPGSVVKTETELIEVLRAGALNAEKAVEFKKESFSYLDGKATKRLLDLVID